MTLTAKWAIIASNDIEMFYLRQLFVHRNGFSLAVFRKSMNVSIAASFAAWKWVLDPFCSVNTSGNADCHSPLV